MVDFNNLEKPYLIGEIGINHNGDLQIAKKLIDGAFATSWSCVKFQKRNPDKCVPEHQKNQLKETPWGNMTYLEYKHRMEFGEEEYAYINKYCKEKPIDWTASVWDHDSLAFLQKFDVPFLKYPSCLLHDLEFLKIICETGKPVIISTGMSTQEEVDKAVEVCQKHASQFVVMVCNSSYPAAVHELNLNLIPVFKKRYNCVIGYSGHEFGLDSTTIACALGAQVIERHITLDHGMWGTDQKASVEIQGMDKLWKQVRQVKQVLGDGQKRVYESELGPRKKLRGY